MEDDYPEYLDAEWGYGYAAWDVASLAERLRAQRLTLEDDAGLLQMQGTETSALCRWAIARQWWQRGHLEHFVELSLSLLAHGHTEEVLRSGEIAVWLVRALAGLGRSDEARRWCDVTGTRWPQYAPISVVALAMVARAEGDAERCAQILEELKQTHGHDPRSCFDVAQWLWQAGARELAKPWIDRARQNTPSDLRVDILLGPWSTPEELTA